MQTDKKGGIYSRNILLEGVGEKGQEKLFKSSVLVIGAGGLGSAAVLYLAAASVGRLGICDFDRVEPSNLNRQILHGRENVGDKKARSAYESVKRLNPDIKIDLIEEKITADNIEEIIKTYDFVIDATDRFAVKFLIDDACVKLKKPYCHGGAAGFGGQVMTYTPESGISLRDVLGKEPSADEEINGGKIGVLGAAAGIIGSLQAMEAVKFLTGAGNLLTGRLFVMDGLAGRFGVMDFGK